MKVIPPALAHDPARRARFRQEAELLASLSHPHIAHVYAFVEDGATALLVMELVPGRTLAERIARGRCRSRRHCASPARSPTRSTPRTSKGVVHRDLKPANVRSRPTAP